MDIEFEQRWSVVIKTVSAPYGENLEIDAVLFLIGVQELGKGFQKYSKDQKLGLMHIAICTLLSQYGYYEFEGQDADGWPHWKATEKLPFLKPLQQNLLMRQAIVDYFESNGLVNDQVD